MKNKLAKWKPYIFLAVLLASLVPLVWLGRYNYPTGDDYYYGTEAHLVWQQTGSIPQAISAACAGVAKSYQIWQGTYSALFLMYLAPNAFSNTAYHLVTFVILLLLCGSIFYLLRPLVCHFLPGTCGEWITISSVFSFLCIQTVAFQSDSFYWYNGSMYYTGFFAVTLFFLGTLLRYLYNGKKILMLPLLLFAIFLGGGNYVSLLPCMLFVVTVTFLLLLQRNKRLMSAELPPLFSCYLLPSVPWPPAIRCGRTACGKFPRGKPLQSACCRVSAIPSPGPDCGGCLPPCFCCRSSCAFYRRKTGNFSPIPSFLPVIPTDCSAPCPVLCSIP